MLLALTASLILFNIPAGPAPKTLRAFAAQSNFNILFQSDEVTVEITHAVSGVLDPIKALQMMTRGTGLGFHFDSPDIALVYVLDPPSQKNKQHDSRTQSQCECIILDGFLRIPYCDDGSPKIHFREQCR